MPERQVITALTGTAAPLLTVNAANRPELDFASFFLPREWKKTVPFVIDYVHLDPNNMNTTQTLSSELRFELPKQANVLSDLILEVNLPPMIVNTPGATIAYSDWLGFALIEHFNIFFGANHTYNRRSMDLYLRVRQTMGIERLESIRKQVYGDQTTAARTALFVNGTQDSPLLIPLFLPFCDDPMMSLPILCLSQKTAFQLQTKPIPSLIYNPSNSTYTANGATTFRLLLQQIHTTGPEGEFLLDLSRHPSGISYMIHQNVRQSDNDFASLTPNARWSQQLAGITKPIKNISFGLIPTRFVNNTGFNEYFFFNPNPPAPIPPGMTPYTPIRGFDIIANGLVIMRFQRRTYNSYHIYDLFHKGFAGEDIYTENYAWWPHAINVASGYLDWTNLNNPTLNIDFGVGGTGIDPINPAIPQSLRLIVNAEDYNFWFFKGGNWTRTFN